jgi:phospholipid/cholesterol/gamma-HCH transport system substrate-binding protein
MEKNEHYIMVGSFVLMAVLGLIAFGAWLNGTTGSRDYFYYQIRFHESVNGLSNGSPVSYRGVDIGNIVSMTIDPAETNTIIARVRISTDAPIRQDTTAMLKIQGITGTRYIDLSSGEVIQDVIEGSKTDKGNLPEIASKYSDLATLEKEIPKLVDQASSVATQTEHLLDDESLAHTHAILQRWDDISKNLEQETIQLDAIIKTTDHLVQTTDKVMSQIDAADINGTLKQLHATSIQLNKLTTSTNAAAAESFENFDDLVLDAKKTSQEIRALAHNLNENPSQVLFPPQQKQEHLP